MDWKDTLAGLRGSVPEAPEKETNEETVAPTPDKPQSGKLHIVVEKKGRHGKTATIIEGFEITEERLEETARRLKQKIGTGGSARGGEILLQGDWKEKARELLKEMGFSVK